MVRIDVRKDRLIVRFKSAGTEEGSHSADDQIFVSVTQQFNTTTSMGRLTLNVLLSFAQFEREVTSERIRDKIAASKRKGLWVGGPLPLGYDMTDGKISRERLYRTPSSRALHGIPHPSLPLDCFKRW